MKRIISTVVATLFGVALLKANGGHPPPVNPVHHPCVFRTELVYADLSNTRLIAAKIIEQNRCMLALKARETFTTSASVSALESDGTIHTFVIAYDERPSSLVVDLREQRSSSVQDVPSKEPRDAAVKQSRHRIFHIGDKAYDLRLLCEDIYISGDNTARASLRNRAESATRPARNLRRREPEKRKEKRTFERNLYPREVRKPFHARKTSGKRVPLTDHHTKDLGSEGLLYETVGRGTLC